MAIRQEEMENLLLVGEGLENLLSTVENDLKEELVKLGKKFPDFEFFELNYILLFLENSLTRREGKITCFYYRKHLAATKRRNEVVRKYRSNLKLGGQNE